MRPSWLAVLGATLVAFVLVGPTGASGIPLTDLLAGGSIEVGGLRFDDFRVLDGPLPRRPIDVATAEVFGLDDDPANPGIRLESNGSFALDSDDNQLAFTLGYRVTVLSAGDLVAGAALGFSAELSPCSTNCPLAILGVALQASPLGAPGFSRLEIENGSGEREVLFSDPTSPANLTPFAPQPELDAAADFILGLALGDGVLELTQLEARYHVVPEPRTFALLGGGLAALGAAGRRAGGG